MTSCSKYLRTAHTIQIFEYRSIYVRVVVYGMLLSNIHSSIVPPKCMSHPLCAKHAHSNNKSTVQWRNMRMLAHVYLTHHNNPIAGKIIERFQQHPHLQPTQNAPSRFGTTTHSMFGALSVPEREHDDFRFQLISNTSNEILVSLIALLAS